MSEGPQKEGLFEDCGGQVRGSCLQEWMDMVISFYNDDLENS